MYFDRALELRRHRAALPVAMDNLILSPIDEEQELWRRRAQNVLGKLVDEDSIQFNKARQGGTLLYRVRAATCCGMPRPALLSLALPCLA